MAGAWMGHLDASLLLSSLPDTDAFSSFFSSSWSSLIFTSLLFLLSSWVAFVLVPYFYVRRPRTGYIAGSESSHLLATGANVPVIHALLILEGQLTPSSVKTALTHAGIPHHRFKRLRKRVSSDWRVCKPLGDHWPPYFVDDPNFDLDRHIRWLEPEAVGEEVYDHRHRARLVTTHASLAAYIAKVVNTPPRIDDRPPWEMLVCPDFVGPDGALVGSALLLRVHHVMSDGLALVAFMDAITTPLHDGQQQGRSRRTGEGGDRPYYYSRGGNHKGVDVRTSSLGSAMKVGLKPQQQQASSSSWWSSWRQGLRLTVKMCVEVPVCMWRDYLAAPDETNLLKANTLTGRKRVAWDSSAITLQQVKATKSALGVTVNDLLLACATGALRHTIIKAAAAKDYVRFFAPMSARVMMKGPSQDLDNQLSVLSLALPTGTTHPIKRLADIARLTTGLKSSTVPLGLSLLWRPMGYLPRTWLQAQSDMLCNKATGVLTNVPGPSHVRVLSGHRVQDLMFWVPAVGNIGMVVSIITYADKLAIGLVVDEAVPCDPQQFVSAFTQEFFYYYQQQTNTTKSSSVAMVVNKDKEGKKANIINTTSMINTTTTAGGEDDDEEDAMVMSG